ncbi:MAG: hypothetical protein ACXVB9_20485 [Bdellovibrionota bacterium]
MKFLLPLSLLSLLPLCAQASPSNSEIAAANAQIVASAQAGVLFLQAHVDDCTSYGSAIKEKLLSPLGKDLENFKGRLARYSENSPQSCTSRADLDYMIGTINGLLAKAKTGQTELMGMSGDQAMSKALCADTSHLNCKAANPANPLSTPQLTAYFAVEQKLAALKTSLTAMKETTDCEKRN